MNALLGSAAAGEVGASVMDAGSGVADGAGGSVARGIVGRGDGVSWGRGSVSAAGERIDPSLPPPPRFEPSVSSIALHPTSSRAR